jgi:hypothetical protein
MEDIKPDTTNPSHMAGCRESKKKNKTIFKAWFIVAWFVTAAQ